MNLRLAWKGGKGTFLPGVTDRRRGEQVDNGVVEVEAAEASAACMPGATPRSYGQEAGAAAVAGVGVLGSTGSPPRSTFSWVKTRVGRI